MSGQDNLATVYRALAGAGLNPAAISGIMGNISIESGFNPVKENPEEGAIGLAQWEGGRRTALKQFAAGQGKTETDLNTQIAFLIQEANQRGNLEQINSLDNPEDAAAYWDEGFEVSSGQARSQRQAAARQFYNFITGNPEGLEGGTGWGSGNLGNLYDDAIGAAGGVWDAASGVLDWGTSLARLLGKLLDPLWWRRIGIGTMGIALIIFGVIRITGTEELIKTAATKGVIK